MSNNPAPQGTGATPAANSVTDTVADTVSDTGPTRVLVLGAGGQIGAELLPELARRYGPHNVVASDLRPLEGNFLFEQLDVLDANRLRQIIGDLGITHVYHLAALLSATGEQNPALAWRINMDGLLTVLDAARDLQVRRLFWPSSIAVFGPDSPRLNTPQVCPMNPGTMYGITKLAGERLCEYYNKRFGLDVRSLRYPGLIGAGAPPGGGTTDYAVHIFHEALKHGHYTCFLRQDTRLPMMYMPDAVRATVELMAAPAASIGIRSSYNITALSFTPAELAELIAQQLPGFSIDYAPDFRQAIADSWTQSIDDTPARTQWGWQPQYDLPALVADMLAHLRPAYAPPAEMLVH